MRLVSSTFIVLVAICCSPSWGVEYSERTWTDDEGRSVQAKLLRLSGATAILDQDGKIVRAPVNRLSDADQEWVKKVRELNHWREWTMIDGSKQRLKFEDKDGDDISLKEGSNTIDVTLDQLSDADRELLAVVFDTEMGTSSGNGSPIARESSMNDVASGQTRQWTNINGKQIDAEYRGMEGEKVVLFFQNREWRVPLAQFSQADQDWVDAQLAPASSGAPSGGTNLSAPAAPPQVAAAPPATLFDRAQSEIRGRMNPGYNSGANSPSAPTVSDPMASHNAAMERMEQNRLENERRAEERLAELQRQQQERMASTLPSSSPSSSSPDESIASGPSVHEPTYPTSAPVGPMVHGYQCFSCNHTWQSTREYGAGDKCPRCGVKFDYMEDENGKIVDGSSSNIRSYRGLIKLIVFAVFAVGGLLAKFAR